MIEKEQFNTFKMFCINNNTTMSEYLRNAILHAESELVIPPSEIIITQAGIKYQITLPLPSKITKTAIIVPEDTSDENLDLLSASGKVIQAIDGWITTKPMIVQKL
jgi:hypothetical protein